MIFIFVDDLRGGKPAWPRLARMLALGTAAALSIAALLAAPILNDLGSLREGGRRSRRGLHDLACAQLLRRRPPDRSPAS